MTSIANARLYSEVPKIDEMTADELGAFLSYSLDVSDPLAAEFFPKRPTGYVEALRLLRSAAWHQLAALQYRAEGDVRKAVSNEHRVTQIYMQLPNYAKWDQI